MQTILAKLEALKSLLVKRLKPIALALIIVQPVMDVFSYFLSLRGSNALSTLMRFALLAAVAALGFVLSDNRKFYLILYGIVAAFWALHVANCWRIGYASVVQDTGNLLRLLNFPLYALTFITMLHDRPELRRVFYLGIAAAFAEIVLFTALPWVTGHPVYTYDALKVGVLGWAATPSAQSAIIVITVPFAIYWAYASKKYILYLTSVLLTIGLMYITGTKLNFYSIFIIAGAYIFLFALQLGRRCWKYAAPLVLVLALAIAFRHQSPMYVRESMSANSQSVYEDMIADTLESSGADASTLKAIRNNGSLVEEDTEIIEVPTPQKVMENMRRALLGIYADDGVYGWRMEQLNDRFGVYNVMQVYDHTDLPSVLSDSRQLKLKFAKLIWEEKDALTHMLGFEYSDYLLGDNVYDLENDFPGVFYNTGYLGFGLYLLFFAIFAWVILRAFFGEVQRAGGGMAFSGGKRSAPVRWLSQFWQGLRRFLTIEVGAVGMSFLLAVIAAQISGSVLRRPNVTIYFAIGAACIFSLTAGTAGPRIKLPRLKGKR